MNTTDFKLNSKAFKILNLLKAGKYIVVHTTVNNYLLPITPVHVLKLQRLKGTYIQEVIEITNPKLLEPLSNENTLIRDDTAVSYTVIGTWAMLKSVPSGWASIQLYPENEHQLKIVYSYKDVGNITLTIDFSKEFATVQLYGRNGGLKERRCLLLTTIGGLASLSQEAIIEGIKSSMIELFKFLK